MDTTGTIIFGIVMLHLIIGFGYVVYKLKRRKEIKHTQ